MKKDIVIIGTGPAGIQAAIHASRKKRDVLVLGSQSKSSLNSALVENYCCMQSVANGKDMLEQGRLQAESFGAKFLSEDVMKVGSSNGKFTIETESGILIETVALIFTMGITRNSLGVKGEKEYHGHGVSYCIECDANFYKGKRVAVIGNGSAAASGAILMTLYAKEVTLVSKDLSISDKLKEQLTSSSVIQKPGTWITEIIGNSKKVTSFSSTDGTTTDVDGIFIELGAKGAMELCVGLGVQLDDEKMEFIQTDKKQATNIPGIFAAGDICGPPFQLAKAVGEGCVAGINASEFVQALKKSGYD